jgi:hypothetical protein
LGNQILDNKITIVIEQLLQLAPKLNIYLNSHFQSLVKEEESAPNIVLSLMHLN